MELKKRGRPRKGNSKTAIFKFRLTESDSEKLNYIVTKTGKTKTQIIREGIRMCYNIALYQE